MLKKIAESLLLNAYSIEQAGILDGKAGISLTLFEMSRHFNDERLEEHAFDLLQEVLAQDVKKNDFASGQAGLAYTVNYLINNKFLNADYLDILGEQHNAVIENIKSLKFNSLNITHYIYYLFFIHSFRQYIDNKDFIKCYSTLVSLINKVLDDFKKNVSMKIGIFFYIYATKLLSIKYVQEEDFLKKIHQIWRKYKQIDHVCQYPLFPIQMYLAGIKEYDALIRLCMDNIILQAIDFKLKTELIVSLYRLYSIDRNFDYRPVAENMTSSLMDENRQSFENNLYNNIVKNNSYGFGINSGISRLILLNIFNDKILHGENIELLNL